MKSAAHHRGRAGTAGRVSRAMLETAHSLSVDLVTAEVVSALRARDVPSILLKGPTIATWLYRDGASRPYGDCDLLVPPQKAAEAQEVLLSLGFRYGYESLGPGPLEEGLFWTRGPDTVDLHYSLQGIRTDRQQVWAILSEHTESDTVSGCEVDVLLPAARAMHVALHAAQHGRREQTPMSDLTRALELLPFESWDQAAGLARRLDALPAFATGLSLLPSGAAVVDRLGIEKDSSVRALLFAETAPTIAFTFEDLRSTPGIVPKARFLARKTFPPRAHMRLYYPLARRGAAGLALTYCHRAAQKLGTVAPALVAWSRARRASR